MAFINTLDRHEDMQDDTFKIVAIRINQCYQALAEKQEADAKDLLELLFFTIDSRLDKKDIDFLEELFVQIDQLIHMPNIKPTPQARSKALTLSKRAYRCLTSALDRKGILLRQEANPSEMYKR